MWRRTRWEWGGRWRGAGLHNFVEEDKVGVGGEMEGGRATQLCGGGQGGRGSGLHNWLHLPVLPAVQGQYTYLYYQLLGLSGCSTCFRAVAPAVSSRLYIRTSLPAIQPFVAT